MSYGFKAMLLSFCLLGILGFSNVVDAQEPVDVNTFTMWLNQTRAQYGLSPVVVDNNMSVWAAVNNQHQFAKGMGHFVIAPARRQNAACMTNNMRHVYDMWRASPPHNAALLDPTITAVGLATVGGYWTFNAR